MSDRVQELCERAIFNGEYDGLSEADRVLDAAEAELLIDRGRVMHGRFLESRVELPGELPAFERAAELYRALGDERGEAEAQFWIGCLHQVVRGDNASAVPFLTTASELARKAGDKLTLSYALRHLGIAATTQVISRTPRRYSRSPPPSAVLSASPQASPPTSSA